MLLLEFVVGKMKIPRENSRRQKRERERDVESLGKNLRERAGK